MPRVKWLIAITLLFLAEPGGAQSPPSPAPLVPAINLPAEVRGEVGDFISIPATTNGSIVQWYSCHKELRLFPANLLKDTKTAVVIGKTPGTYRLLAYTALGDQPSAPAVVSVIIDGQTPPAPPGPGPTPVPPVSATKLFLLTIDDETTRPAAIGKLLGDVDYWDSIRAKGHGFASIDVSNPRALAYLKLLPPGSQPPVLFVMSNDPATKGKVLKMVAIPADKAGVDALISSLSK